MKKIDNSLHFIVTKNRRKMSEYNTIQHNNTIQYEFYVQIRLAKNGGHQKE